jgi:four helix bundle protein
VSAQITQRQTPPAPERILEIRFLFAKKEAQETNYWLSLLTHVSPENQVEINELQKESHELTLIFHKITSSLKNA